MHPSTIARASPLFAQAVGRGDATEALRLGRQIMWACQEHERALGRGAARRSWAGRVGLALGIRVESQEVMHYRAVQENVSLTLQAMGVDRIDADTRCIVQDDAESSRPLSGSDRLADAERVKDDLEHVSTLYTAVAAAVTRANPYIETLNRNIEDAGPSIDRSTDALIRHYADQPAGPGLSGRLVGCIRAACPAGPSACACLLLTLAAGTLGFGTGSGSASPSPDGVDH